MNPTGQRENFGDPQESFGNASFPNARPDLYVSTVASIVPLCGHEFIGTRPADFHSTIQVLTDRLKLPFDQSDVAAFGLLLTGLGGTARYRGDYSMRPGTGENSAVHSCQTAILMNELFRRAGLLEPRVLTPELNSVRQSLTISCLLHDMGEMLGEFSTVAERAITAGCGENVNLERPIFKRAVELAYRAVTAGEPALFYLELNQMLDALQGLVQERLSVHSGADVLNAEQILQVIGPHDHSQVPPAWHERVEKLLSLYDIAEMRATISTLTVLDDSEAKTLFQGYAVKAVEHLQGVRHLLRFCTKSSDYKRVLLFSPSSKPYDRHEKLSDLDLDTITLPASSSTSARVQTTVRYVEGEVGVLFAAARTNEEVALAKAIRDGVYQTVVELLNGMNQAVDREVQSSSGSISDLVRFYEAWRRTPEAPAKLTALNELLAEKRREEFALRAEELAALSSSDQLSNRLLRVESRRRLMGLYLQAIEVDYRPKPNEILMMHREIPAALSPLRPANLRALRTAAKNS